MIPATINQPTNITNVIVDATVATQALIVANGNVNLAAERLHISPQVLTAIVAGDPISAQLLTDQIRISTIISTFDILNQIKIVLLEKIVDLEAKDAIRAYGALLTSLSTLMAPIQAAQAQNPMDALMRMLPPEVRRALMEVVDTTQQDLSNG